MPFVRLTVVTIFAVVLVIEATSLSQAINPFARGGFELTEGDIVLLKRGGEKTLSGGRGRNWSGRSLEQSRIRKLRYRDSHPEACLQGLAVPQIAARHTHQDGGGPLQVHHRPVQGTRRELEDSVDIPAVVVILVSTLG